MKIVGLLCILLGSILLGLRYGWELQVEREERKDLLYLIQRIKVEIRFGNASLPECFYKLGMGKDIPYKEALLKISKEVRTSGGESLYDLMLEAFPVSADMTTFLSCFQNSSEETRGILNALEQVGEELCKKNLRLEQELENRKKLGLSLGTMGGLMGILLFL